MLKITLTRSQEHLKYILKKKHLISEMWIKENSETFAQSKNKPTDMIWYGAKEIDSHTPTDVNRA